MKIVIVLTVLLFLSGSVPAQEKLTHAVDLYRAAKYAEAVDELEKLDSTGEGNHQSVIYLGAALAQLGKEKEARIAFTRAAKTKLIKDLEGETSLKITTKRAPGSDGVPNNYQEGTTVLAIEFKADKTIGLIFVVRSTTNEFIKNCTEAAKKIKFEPATSSGNAVTVIKLVEYTFSRY